MSNIYIKEPPTSGKVLLETSVGDIDIELWCKECPKACRNFIQLCMEGYYDDTFFHRLVPGFLIQGGDRTGTGDGGESVYGKPFKDEFHQRLKFERRGLVGMASTEPNQNRSQFFFTLGPAQELTGKNTLFGKVSGNTLYNMLALGDMSADGDGTPAKKCFIYKTEILNNPFDDVEPRDHSLHSKQNKDEGKSRKRESQVQAIKNFNLLSFGEEAEEEEDENDEVIASQFRGKVSKSAHDLLKNDTNLAKETGDLKLESQNLKRSLADDGEEEKLPTTAKRGRRSSDPDSDESNDCWNHEQSSKKNIEKLREESAKLKEELMMKTAKKKSAAKEKEIKDKKEDERIDDMYSTAYMKKYRHLRTIKAKNQSEKNAKQDNTMKMLAEFEAKLNAANRLNLASNYEDEEEDDADNTKSSQVDHNISGADFAAWMTHCFQPEIEDAKQARDANMERAEDEYEIFDPRNPMNKRRRERAKQAAKDRSKPLAGVKDIE